jgi:hypothetical protein
MTWLTLFAQGVPERGEKTSATCFQEFLVFDHTNLTLAQLSLSEILV